MQATYPLATNHKFPLSAFQLFSISVFRFSLQPFPFQHFSFQHFSISLQLFPHFRLATRRQSRYLLRCPRVRRNPHFLLQIACNMGQNHRHVKGCLTHGMILPLCCTLEET